MSFHPMDPNTHTEYNPARSLFKRCVSCGNDSPACPTCDDGYTCSMSTQTCDSCATTKCIKSPESSSSPPQSSGPNTGAIAGGVVGAIAALALILFLIYWFVIRKRRAERAEQQEKSSQFAAARSGRQSTQSIASTVLTRASNVIQIAYIPGVTNRSPPDTPGSLVPPVPPLPGAHPDQHFFMPGDLRDSSWTAMTGHQSISPTLRSSVATTIYRSDAIVSPMPAQQIARSRANIVSVHSGPGTPNTPDGTPVVITPADAPAVPAITSAQLAKAGALQAGASPAASTPSPSSSIVARQVMAKPVMVRATSLKKKDGPKVVGAKNVEKPTTGDSASTSQFDHQTSTFDNNSSDEDNDTRPSSPSHSATTPKKGVPAISVVEVPESPDENQENEGPFKDQKTNSSTHSRDSRHINREPPARVESPFSDANEVK